MSETFRIAGKSVPSGKKLKALIKVAQLSDSTPVSIPLIVVNGRKPGPTLLLTSGAHGSEWTGMEIVRETALNVSPNDLSGTLVAIAGVNPFAYLRGTYVNLFSMDLSMGAQIQYPGDKAGTYVQRLGYILLNEFLMKADAVIDNHDGAAHWIARYIICSCTEKTAAKLGKKKLELAKAFGTGLPIEDATPIPTPSPPTPASILGEAGIPHITVEIGGLSSFWPDDIRRGIKGMNNAMKHMGMLKGKPEPSKQDVFSEYKWIRTDCGGVVRTAFSAFEVPKRVKKGEELCTVTTMLGDELQTIESPYDGVVFNARAHGACFTGDWLYGVGKIP